MDETCIITIGGDLGSGKSTVAKLMAEQLGTALYSTGGLQRRMAETMGLTSLQLNKLAETDPTIDRKIDGSTVEIAAQEKRVIFDSRLAWHFVPDAFKVYLTVDPREGAERILRRRDKVELYENLEEALARVTERRASEDKRFGEIYGVQMNRLSNYHLVVDSTKNGPEIIAEEIIRQQDRWQSGEPFGQGGPLVALHPTTPFPLNHPWDSTPTQQLRVLRVGRYYYWHTDATDGPLRAEIAESIAQGTPLVSATVAACDDDPVADGLTAREWVEQEATLAKSYAWEAANGFHYPSYPPHFAPSPVARP